MADNELDDFNKLLNSADDFSGGLDDPSEDPDSVSRSVINDARVSVRGSVTGDRLASALATSMGKSAPEAMAENASELTDAVSNTIDSGMKDLEEVRKTVAETVGGVAEIAPESFKGTLNRIQQWIHEKDEFSGRTSGPTEEERIKSEVSGILNVENSKSSDNNELQDLLALKSNKLQARSVLASERLLRSKFDVDYKYYQRDLELQSKQVLTMVAMHDILNKYSDINTKQLEAIVKNTGLPDVAKNRMSDITKKLMGGSIKEIGFNAFTKSNIYADASKNVNNLISEQAQKVMAGTGLVNTVVDAKRMQKEMGITGQQMLLDTLSKKAVSTVTDYGSDKLIKAMLKTDDGQSTLRGIDKASDDPKRALEKLLASAREDPNASNMKITALETAIGVLGNNLKSASYNLKEGVNLTDAATYTNKTQEVTDVVVPNLLSKILAEVTTIRKGSTTVSDKDKLTYDHSKGKFVSEKDVQKDIKSRLSATGSTLASAVSDKNLATTLTGNSNLSKDERKALATGLIKYLTAGKSASPYNLIEDGFLDYIPNADVKDSVKNKLEVLTNPKSKDDYKKIKSLKDTLSNIQTTKISNLKDITNSVSKTTNTTALSNLGITDKNDNNVVNSDSIQKTNAKYALEALDRPNAGFKTGGYSGDGETNEKAGITHYKEYILNNQKLTKLLSSVKNEDTSEILKTVNSIATEVSRTSSDNKLTNGLSDGINNLSKSLASSGDKFDHLANDLNFKNISERGTNKLNDLTPAVEDLQNNSIKLVSTLSNGISDTINNVSKGFNTTKKSITNMFTGIVKPKSIENVTNNISKIASNSYSKVNEKLDTMVATYDNNKEDVSKTLLSKLNKLPSSVMDTLSIKKQEMPDKDKLDRKNLSIATDVTDMFGGIKNVLSKDDTKDKDATKKLDDKIKTYGIEAVIKGALLDYPIPENENDALTLYKRTLNAIDPLGTYKKELSSDSEILKVITKLHEESITDGREKVLESIGEGDNKGTIGHRAFEKLPTPLKNMLDNKFTDLTSKIKDRAKKALVNTGKAMMPGLKDIGGDIKQSFRGADGGFRIPNLVELSKLTGKTYLKGIHTTGMGIRELYPEIFGAGKDIAKYAGHTAFDGLLGAKTGPRHTNIKLPVDAKTFDLWSKGKLTGKDVLKSLKTDEEREAWITWLKEKSKSELTLPNILKASGKVYLKSMVSAGPIVRKAYTNAARLALAASKATVRTAIHGHSFSKSTLMDAAKDSISSELQKPSNNPDFESEAKVATRGKKVSGFSKGGYTGDGEVKEVAGITHKKEFVINNKMLDELVNSVKSINTNKITEIASKITSDVAKTSSHYAKKTSSKIKEVSANGYDAMGRKLNETMGKLLIATRGLVTEFSRTNPNILLVPILKKLDDHLDILIKKNKEKQVFDKNGDGRRDGNAIDRFAKLYKDHQDKKPVVEEVVERKANTVCFGGTSCLTRLAMYLGMGLATYFGFTSESMGDVLRGTKDVLSGVGEGISMLWHGSQKAWKASERFLSDIVTFGKHSYNYLKTLPEGISLALRGALSFIPGISKPTDAEKADYKARSRGEDTPEEKKAKEEKKALETNITQNVTSKLKNDYIAKKLKAFDNKNKTVSKDGEINEEAAKARVKYQHQLSEEWETKVKHSPEVAKQIARSVVKQTKVAALVEKPTEESTDESGISGHTIAGYALGTGVVAYLGKKVINAARTVGRGVRTVGRVARTVGDVATLGHTARVRHAREDARHLEQVATDARRSETFARATEAGHSNRVATRMADAAEETRIRNIRGSQSGLSGLWGRFQNRVHNGITAVKDKVINAAHIVKDKVVDVARRSASFVGDKLSSLLRGLGSKTRELYGKVMRFMGRLKTRIIEHFGPRLAASRIARIAARVAPFAGIAFIAYDMASLAWYMLKMKLPFLSALSMTYLGFDLFSDDEDKKKNIKGKEKDTKTKVDLKPKFDKDSVKPKEEIKPPKSKKTDFTAEAKKKLNQTITNSKATLNNVSKTIQTRTEDGMNFVKDNFNKGITPIKAMHLLPKSETVDSVSKHKNLSNQDEIKATIKKLGTTYGPIYKIVMDNKDIIYSKIKDYGVKVNNPKHAKKVIDDLAFKLNPTNPIDWLIPDLKIVKKLLANKKLSELSAISLAYLSTDLFIGSINKTKPTFLNKIKENLNLHTITSRIKNEKTAITESLQHGKLHNMADGVNTKIKNISTRVATRVNTGVDEIKERYKTTKELAKEKMKELGSKYAPEYTKLINGLNEFKNILYKRVSHSQGAQLLNIIYEQLALTKPAIELKQNIKKIMDYHKVTGKSIPSSISEVYLHKDIISDTKVQVGESVAKASAVLGLQAHQVYKAGKKLYNFSDIHKPIDNLYTKIKNTKSSDVVNSVSDGIDKVSKTIVETESTLVKKALSKLSVKNKKMYKKVMKYIKVLNEAIVKKFGKKASIKIIAKIMGRLVPFIGIALITLDMAKMYWYLQERSLPFLSALSMTYLNMDIFSESNDKLKGRKTFYEAMGDKISDNTNELYDTVTHSLSGVTKRKPVNNDIPSIKTPINNHITKSPLTKSNVVKPPNKKEDKGWFSTIVGDVEKYAKAKMETFKTNVMPKASGNLKDPAGGIDNLIIGKNVDVGGLVDNMQDSLYSMANEYFELTGKRIPINSGYRSRAYQASLRRKMGSKAARPGHSTHEFGLAIDTNTSTANELDKLGLMRKYGFTRPIGKEGWHVEPAGIQERVNDAKHNIELANNLIEQGIGKGGGGWGLVEKARKYSRNARYQETLMKEASKPVTTKQKDTVGIGKVSTTTSNKVTTSNKDNSIFSSIKSFFNTKEKTKVTKPTVDLTKQITKPTKAIDLKHNTKIITGGDIEHKINTTQTKDKVQQVKVINNHNTPDVHLDTEPMVKKQSVTNDILESTKQAMTDMSNKMSTLVTLNEQLVKHILESNTKEHSNNTKKTNETLPSHKRVMGASHIDF